MQLMNSNVWHFQTTSSKRKVWTFKNSNLLQLLTTVERGQLKFCVSGVGLHPLLRKATGDSDFEEWRRSAAARQLIMATNFHGYILLLSMGVIKFWTQFDNRPSSQPVIVKEQQPGNWWQPPFHSVSWMGNHSAGWANTSGGIRVFLKWSQISSDKLSLTT